MVYKDSRSRVLVVLPTLGQRPTLLRQTLESLVSQQKQALDIILVCPRKSRTTHKLAREFGAALADDPGGLSAAVNVGIAHAKPHHEYITWIGDDDLLTPGSLAATTRALDANPHTVLAFGYCEYIDDTGQHLFTSKAGRLAPWLMTWGPNLVPLPGILFRLSALQAAGDFDPSLKYVMDLDMLLRLRKQGKFFNTQQTVAAFRWHSSSTTVANRTASLDEAEMVKRRYLPKPLRLFAPIWEKPVRFATSLAARRVNALARSKSMNSA